MASHSALTLGSCPGGGHGPTEEGSSETVAANGFGAPSLACPEEARKEVPGRSACWTGHHFFVDRLLRPFPHCKQPAVPPPPSPRWAEESEASPGKPGLPGQPWSPLSPGRPIWPGSPCGPWSPVSPGKPGEWEDTLRPCWGPAWLGGEPGRVSCTHTTSIPKFATRLAQPCYSLVLVS